MPPKEKWLKSVHTDFSHYCYRHYISPISVGTPSDSIGM